MKSVLPRLSHVLPLFAATLLLAGCDLIGDILEFGFWVAVIILVLVIALIWWVVRKIGSRGRRPPPAP